MHTNHTRPRASAAHSPLGGLATMALVLLKVVLGIVGFMLLLGALMLGLLLALGIVIWARLRGRKAAPGVFTAAFAKARLRPMAAAGEVVDVEVREVPDMAGPGSKS